MLTLRRPTIDEACVLTDLCLRSKAVWGYDEAFMHACRGELTIESAELCSPWVQVAECSGRLVGFVQMRLGGATAELSRLFVEPTDLRTGVGRRLFNWATTVARNSGATTLMIEADPGAVGFYRRMGARDDGTAPSGSIPGRFIPRLLLSL